MKKLSVEIVEQQFNRLRVLNSNTVAVLCTSSKQDIEFANIALAHQLEAVRQGMKEIADKLETVLKVEALTV